MDEQSEPVIAQKLRTLRIIAGAMMLSGVLYAGVLFVVAGEPAEVDVAINLGLIAATVAVTVALLPVRRVVMGGLALLPPPQGGLADPQPEPEASAAILAAAMRYTSGTIVSLALSESVILFGFVQAWLSQQPLRILPFLLAGELMMVVMFPRRAGLESLLSPATRAALRRQEG